MDYFKSKVFFLFLTSIYHTPIYYKTFLLFHSYLFQTFILEHRNQGYANVQIFLGPTITIGSLVLHIFT
jgi:hypothetical protein